MTTPSTSGHDPPDPFKEDDHGDEGKFCSRFPIPPTSIIGASKCSLTHPGARNLVVNKGTRIEVYAYDIGTESLSTDNDADFDGLADAKCSERNPFQIVMLSEKSIYGGYAHAVEPLRPPECSVDLLWVCTSALRCAIFGWSGEAGALVMLWSADVSSIFFSIAGTRQRNRVHSNGKYVGISFVKGEFHLAEIVYDGYKFDEESCSHCGRVGIQVHTFKVGCDDELIDYALMAEETGLIFTTLRLAGIFGEGTHAHPQNSAPTSSSTRRYLRIFRLDFDAHEFIELSSEKFVDGAADISLLQVVQTPGNGSGEGVIVLSPKEAILYTDDRIAARTSVPFAVPQAASELRVGSLGSAPVSSSLLDNGQVLVGYADGRIHMVACYMLHAATRTGLFRRHRKAAFELSVVEVLSSADAEGVSGGQCGVLALSRIDIVSGGMWVEVNVDNGDAHEVQSRGIVFVISAFGDSSIASIAIVADAPPTVAVNVEDAEPCLLNTLSVPCAREKIRVLHRFASLGPITCMASLRPSQLGVGGMDKEDREGDGGAGLLIGSGLGTGGMVTLARPGIGFGEVASVLMRGITGLWSVVVGAKSHLVMSFVNETRIMTFGDDDVLEEAVLPFMHHDCQTLYAGNAAGGVVFVTAKGVRFVMDADVDADAAEGEHASPRVADWQPDKGRSIVIAGGADGCVVVALSEDKLLCYLECAVGEDCYPAVHFVSSVSLSADVSCVSLFVDDAMDPLEPMSTPVSAPKEAPATRSGSFDLGGIVNRARRHIRNASITGLGFASAWGQRDRQRSDADAGAGEGSTPTEAHLNPASTKPAPVHATARHCYVAVGLWRTNDVLVLSAPTLEIVAHRQLPLGVVSRSILMQRIGIGGPCLLLVGLADGHLVYFEFSRRKFPDMLSGRRTLLVGSSPLALSPFARKTSHSREEEWCVLIGCDRSAVVRMTGGRVRIHPAGLAMPARLCCKLSTTPDASTESFVIATADAMYVGEMDGDLSRYRLTLRSDTIGCTPRGLAPFKVKEPAAGHVVPSSTDGAGGGDGFDAGAGGNEAELSEADEQVYCDYVAVLCGEGNGDFARSVIVWDPMARRIVGRCRLPGRLAGTAVAALGTPLAHMPRASDSSDTIASAVADEDFPEQLARDTVVTGATAGVAAEARERDTPASVRSASSLASVAVAEVPSPHMTSVRSVDGAGAAPDASRATSAADHVVVRVDAANGDDDTECDPASLAHTATGKPRELMPAVEFETPSDGDAYIAVVANPQSDPGEGGGDDHSDGQNGIVAVYNVRKLPLMGQFDGTAAPPEARDKGPWPFRVSLLCSSEVEGPAACVAEYNGMIAVGSGCTLSLHFLSIRSDVLRRRSFASLRQVASRTFDAFIVSVKVAGGHLVVCDMLEGVHVVSYNPAVVEQQRRLRPVESMHSEGQASDADRPNALSIVGVAEPPRSGYIRACSAVPGHGIAMVAADCFGAVRVHSLPPQIPTTSTVAAVSDAMRALHLHDTAHTHPGDAAARVHTVAYGMLPAGCTLLMGEWPFELPLHWSADTRAIGSPGILVGCASGAVGLLRSTPPELHVMLSALEAALSTKTLTSCWAIETSTARLRSSDYSASNPVAVTMGSGTSIARPAVHTPVPHMELGGEGAIAAEGTLAGANQANDDGGGSACTVSAFVDGDFVAEFLALGEDEQEAIAAEMAITVGELTSELEAFEYSLM